MPDLETRPTGPLPAMFAGGVMPTSASPGVMMPGAVGADDAGLVALLHVVRPRVRGVLHGDALGDDHEQRDLRVDGLDDGVLREGRGNERDRDVRAGLLHGLGDGAEDGKLDRVAVLVGVRDRGAGLAGVHAADDLGARLEHQRGVLGALAAGDALDDDLGILGKEDCHCSVCPFTSLRTRARQPCRQPRPWWRRP